MLYDTLQNEFADKFAKTTLDFDQQYDIVMDKAKTQGNDDVILNVARQLLSEVLRDYANSKATTWWGKVGRWFSGVGSVVVKYVNVGNIFKKK